MQLDFKSCRRILNLEKSDLKKDSNIFFNIIIVKTASESIENCSFRGYIRVQCTLCTFKELIYYLRSVH